MTILPIHEKNLAPYIYNIGSTLLVDCKVQKYSGFLCHVIPYYH